MAPAMKDEDRKKNVRMALILASIVLVFFLGYIGKHILLTT